ncbi:MAG: hypothetical protein ACO3QC_10935 [Phycisphaerales bacterium]
MNLAALMLCAAMVASTPPPTVATDAVAQDASKAPSDTIAATAPQAEAPRVRVSCRWTKCAHPDSPEPRDADERNRAQLGRLLFARVLLECDGASAEEALDALRAALGLNLVIHRAGRNGLDLSKGIDPSIELDLALRDIDGRAALETIAALCGNDVTWQLRDGMVEFGPKRTLAREPAQERRIYDLTDQSLIAPDYQYVAGGASLDRISVTEAAGELMRVIAMECEPEAFEPKPPEAGREPTTPRKPVAQAPGAATKAREKADEPDHTANFDPRYGPMLVKGKWSTMQLRGTQLIVRAPDFVHRAIVGYGEPIPPKADAPRR